MLIHLEIEIYLKHSVYIHIYNYFYNRIVSYMGHMENEDTFDFHKSNNKILFLFRVRVWCHWSKSWYTHRLLCGPLGNFLEKTVVQHLRSWPYNKVHIVDARSIRGSNLERAELSWNLCFQGLPSLSHGAVYQKLHQEEEDLRRSSWRGGGGRRRRGREDRDVLCPYPEDARGSGPSFDHQPWSRQGWKHHGEEIINARREYQDTHLGLETDFPARRFCARRPEDWRRRSPGRPNKWFEYSEKSRIRKGTSRDKSKPGPYAFALKCLRLGFPGSTLWLWDRVFKVTNIVRVV